MVERVVSGTHLRPTSVEVRRESDTRPIGQRDAVLTLPDDARLNLIAVADTIATHASLRLIFGDSQRFALRHLALGRDDLQEHVSVWRGVKLDRKTIANILLELQELGVIERVGQLQSWTDIDDGEIVRKRGAFVYALNVGIGKIGSLAQAQFRRILAITPPSATVRGNGPEARLQGCLNWAVNDAARGNRNSIGHWLACRCKDIGVNYAKANATMKSYYRGVDQGRPIYTWGEAAATLRSVYRERKQSQPHVPADW